jgi:SLT domain-containing protein
VFANGPALADVEELKQALASIPGAVFTRADFDPTQLFLQGRQHGGPVRRGEAYLVGEGGRPEVFVPSADGTVVPIDAAHPVSGGVVVHGPLATFAITGAGADVEAAVRRAANEELVPVFDRLLDRLAAGAGTRS